jgi:hypothetical protein
MARSLRLDFEDLLRLQDVLDIRLVLGEISWSRYEREWRHLLKVAGYSMIEYERCIDARWDSRVPMKHVTLLS